MGFFSSLFNKPSKEDISKFNLALNFRAIPGIVDLYQKSKVKYSDLLDIDKYPMQNFANERLAKEVTISDTGINHYPNLKMVLIKVPSTEMMSEVAAALIMIDTDMKRAEAFTMEYSLDSYIICQPGLNGQHYNLGIEVKDGEEFAEFVLKHILKKWAATPRSSTNSPTRPKVSETSKPQMPSFAPLQKKSTMSNSDKANASESLPQYFPYLLDNTQFKHARQSGMGAQAAAMTMNVLIEQMEARYSEWKGLFSVRAVKNWIEVTCYKGFEDNTTIQAIPCLWRRKSYVENCMLLSVQRIVFIDEVAKTFDQLDIDKLNPANYN